LDLLTDYSEDPEYDIPERISLRPGQSAGITRGAGQSADASRWSSMSADRESWPAPPSDQQILGNSSSDAPHTAFARRLLHFSDDAEVGRWR
jgi:hypothetical protein